MSVTYFAYLCYPLRYSYEDDTVREPEIKFEEPAKWKYQKVLPIQFSVLHKWTNKDKELYT